MSPPRQEIELAFLEQIFATTAKAFFDYGHSDNYSYGGVGSSLVVLFEQRSKYGFNNLRGDVCIKMIVPRFGIIIFYASRLPIWMEGVDIQVSSGIIISSSSQQYSNNRFIIMNNSII